MVMPMNGNVQLTMAENKEMTNSKAHVIVVSNEKGGTGKSTISMHLAIKLMQEGFRVAVVDTDGRQGTLTHYIETAAVSAAKTT